MRAKNIDRDKFDEVTAIYAKNKNLTQKQIGLLTGLSERSVGLILDRGSWEAFLSYKRAHLESWRKLQSDREQQSMFEALPGDRQKPAGRIAELMEEMASVMEQLAAALRDEI